LDRLRQGIGSGLDAERCSGGCAVDRGSEIVAVAHAAAVAANNGRAGVRYGFSPVRGNVLHLWQPTALVEAVGVEAVAGQHDYEHGGQGG
jgi:hypothetical protein